MEAKARKNRVPGPGSYRFPSDFGQYDGDVYDRKPSMYSRTLDTTGLRGAKETIRSSRA